MSSRFLAGHWMKEQIRRMQGKTRMWPRDVSYSLEEKMLDGTTGDQSCCHYIAVCAIQTCTFLCFGFFIYSRGCISLQLSLLATSKIEDEA